MSKADRPLTDKILLERIEKLYMKYKLHQYYLDRTILFAERLKELLSEIDRWTVENIAEKVNSLWA